MLFVCNVACILLRDCWIVHTTRMECPPGVRTGRGACQWARSWAMGTAWRSFTTLSGTCNLTFYMGKEPELLHEVEFFLSGTTCSWLLFVPMQRTAVWISLFGGVLDRAPLHSSAEELQCSCGQQQRRGLIGRNGLPDLNPHGALLVVTCDRLCSCIIRCVGHMSWTLR